MSFPNIPDIRPEVGISRQEVITLLLASIALEENGLAHIINAEAEKLQYLIGMLKDHEAPRRFSIGELLEVNRSVERVLKSVVKNQMLLQFKLEDILLLIDEAAQRKPANSTTTQKTPTTADSPENSPITKAVFENCHLNSSSSSRVSGNIQADRNMIVCGNYNQFMGNINVGGVLTDFGRNNYYQKLTVDDRRAPIVVYEPSHLRSGADLILEDDVVIDKQCQADKLQGKKVWVDGSVVIVGSDITIVGGGIFAKDNIIVSSSSFTYETEECFALYSQENEIIIASQPYKISGLIYTASSQQGNILLTSCKGGCVYGSIMAARDAVFSVEEAVRKVCNDGLCSP